jgi:uncharacterized Fe-S center protein
MKSKVIFIPGSRGDFESGKNFGKVLSALNEFGLKDFAKKRVLVKLHMGERGNEFYLKPAVIKHFVDALLAIKAKPFLFDTVVMYEGGRNTKEKHMATAKEHGFDRLGCPVVIGNEGNTVNVKVNKNTYGFEVAKEVCDAECILSVAHGKGHMMSGFGGSIKAFGMGGLSKEGKTFIHKSGVPIVDKGKCKLCEACVRACAIGAIEKKGDNIVVDYTRCGSCEKCIRACPNSALKWKSEEFDMMLAAGSAACLNTFNASNRPKKKIFVNVLVDISKQCDCAGYASEIISPDIGVVVSDDPVAADAASIDLIEKVADTSLKEVENADPRLHVRHAQQLGIGRMEYDIVRH